MRKGEHRMIAPSTNPKRKRGVRPALTLLEVVIALAIFLLAMTVFSQMLLRNGEIARDIQRQNLATRLCQSKLAEVVAGVVPLSSQGDVPFVEEPDYTWSLTADNGSVAGLWNVTVNVARQQTDSGNPIQCSLAQMVLDPSIIGSTQDAPAVSGTAANTDNSASAATPAAAATPTATPAAAPTPSKAATPTPSKAAAPNPTSGPTPVKGK
jgi:general secretion pathway protein I